MSTRLAGSKRRSLDQYFTPDPLAELLVSVLPRSAGKVALDPHAGGGAFIRAMSRVGLMPFGMDLDPNSPGKSDCLKFQAGDFLTSSPPVSRIGYQWIIGNPPFSDAQAHVERALEVSDRNVAFLLRLAFLESAKRVPFWSRHPCRKIWVLSSRPSFTGNGRHDSCAYGFFWWDSSFSGPTELEVLDTRVRRDQ